MFQYLPFIFITGTVILLPMSCRKPQDQIVIYCAQDPEFAEKILKPWEEKNRITVTEKYDTEANKSVSLFEELKMESARPRADLWWNNEILATIRMHQLGFLESYISPQEKNYDEKNIGKDHSYIAFAGRLRVIVVNTKLVSAKDYPTSIFDLLDSRWQGKIAIAKPQFGTSATHASCLFEVLGEEKAKQWYRGLKQNKVQLVPGNKQVAEGVAAGDFAIGITDQDDAIEELDHQKAIAIILPDAKGNKEYERLGTLLIPNTLALIKNGPNPQKAKELFDYLISPETEIQLGLDGAFQIPLNRSKTCDLHIALQDYKNAKKMEVDFEKAAKLWDSTQKFLRDEFTH